MTTAYTLVSEGGMLHATIDGTALCGDGLDELAGTVIKTGNPTPVGVWAALTTFSGGCAACVDELEGDPAVAQFR